MASSRKRAEGDAEPSALPSADSQPDPAGESKTEKRNEELATMQDGYLRLQADFENYRKRIERTLAESVRSSKAELLRGFLPVVDNLARALESMGADGVDLQSVVEGVRLTHRQFMDALKRHGVQAIEAEGQFDPRLHQVVATVNDPERQDGQIVDELLKGFLFEGEVLRPTSVRVARNEGAPPSESLDVRV